MITLSTDHNESEKDTISTVHAQNMVTLSAVISYFYIISLKSFLLLSLAFSNINQLFTFYYTTSSGCCGGGFHDESPM